MFVTKVHLRALCVRVTISMLLALRNLTVATLTNWEHFSTVTGVAGRHIRSLDKKNPTSAWCLCQPFDSPKHTMARKITIKRSGLMSSFVYIQFSQRLLKTHSWSEWMEEVEINSEPGCILLADGNNLPDAVKNRLNSCTVSISPEKAVICSIWKINERRWHGSPFYFLLPF